MQEADIDVTHFSSVDQAANPSSFPQFMDRSHALQTASAYKQSIIERLALREGATVLDVGCGTGQDALELAQVVGPSGQVIGIDSSETMLQEARTRVASTQLPIEFVLADAMELPFADASFDGCRAARVLGYLREPERALAEMVRVARPGGRIVTADADFDLTVIELPDRAFVRKMTHAICDQMEQGWLGRQMPRLFQQAGLEDIRVEGRMMRIDYPFFQLAFRGIVQRAHDAGAISTQELTRFWDALAQSEQEHHFFAGSVGFIVSGRKAV